MEPTYREELLSSISAHQLSCGPLRVASRGELLSVVCQCGQVAGDVILPIAGPIENLDLKLNNLYNAVEKSHRGKV